MEISTAILTASTSSLIACAIGYVLGKRAKLRELHQLQDEGLLSITYMGKQPNTLPHPGGGDDAVSHEAQAHGPSMHELLHGEGSSADELERVRYVRRDDEERRDDWAIALKAQQLRERAAQGQGGGEGG